MSHHDLLLRPADAAQEVKLVPAHCNCIHDLIDCEVLSLNDRSLNERPNEHRNLFT